MRLQPAGAGVVDGAMAGHAAQPRRDMFRAGQPVPPAVQLQEDLLSDLLGGLAVAQNMQRDREDHRLVLTHQRGELGLGFGSLHRL